jgi:hypothetical protein
VCSSDLIAGLVTKNKDYTALYVLRITGFPTLMISVVKSRILEMTYISMIDSTFSLVTFFVVLLIICFYFGIMSLQIWSGGFAYCSYDLYPTGENLFLYSSKQFPYGCNGLANVSNSNSLNLTNIYPENPINTYNNIFSSCESIFRIVMSNNWAGICISSLSYLGFELEPRYISSSVSFLFYLFLGVIALFFSCFFAAALFYHYLIVFYFDYIYEYGSLFREEEVVWLEMMVIIYLDTLFSFLLLFYFSSEYSALCRTNPRCTNP